MCHSGDRTVTAQCQTGLEVERELRHRHTVLLSCTDITQDNSSSYTGLDCVNGTLLPHQTSHHPWDWSAVRDILQSDNKRLEIPAAPSTTSLRIFDKTRVRIFFF